MTRLIAAALLAGTAIATPATAAPIFFDFVAYNPSQSASFTIDSASAFGSYGSSIFVRAPVNTSSGTFNGFIEFFENGVGGGLHIANPDTFSDFVSTLGPQIYTGTITNPMFFPGTFGLNGYSGFAGGVLTVTPSTPAVPEPATWAMMIAGFGTVGFAMRHRQKVTAKVRFA